MFELSISYCIFFFFFFNDTATTEIYTLSLHDALPISLIRRQLNHFRGREIDTAGDGFLATFDGPARAVRSEEHTSELQSRLHLVCRLLLEKKKKKHKQADRHAKRQTPVRGLVVIPAGR